MDRKYIHKMLGEYLYYAISLDPIILAALGTLYAAQSKGTDETKVLVDQLIDYCDKNIDAKLRYHASNMELLIHND